MMFVSVTRLRVRSIIYLLPFGWYVLRTARQLARSQGFVGGNLLIEARFTFWTATVWESEAAMRSYRNSGAHRTAMPHLLQWCDEASVVHWSQESDPLPGWPEAYRRMVAEGRPSRVDHPSPAHRARQIPEPRLSKHPAERSVQPKRKAQGPTRPF